MNTGDVDISSEKKHYIWVNMWVDQAFDISSFGILFNPKTVKSQIQGGIYSMKTIIFLETCQSGCVDQAFNISSLDLLPASQQIPQMIPFKLRLTPSQNNGTNKFLLNNGLKCWQRNEQSKPIRAIWKQQLWLNSFNIFREDGLTTDCQEIICKNLASFEKPH